MSGHIRGGSASGSGSKDSCPAGGVPSQILGDFSIVSFNVDDIVVNISPAAADYEMALTDSLDPDPQELEEIQKGVTESIFEDFQSFLWEFVTRDENREIWSYEGTRRISGNKYIVVRHMASGTDLFFMVHAPFTLRYEARAVRVLDETVVNFRSEDMDLDDLLAANKQVEKWFVEIINNFISWYKEKEDPHEYTRIWHRILKLAFEESPRTLSRLDLNINIDGSEKFPHPHLRNRQVSAGDLLKKYFQAIYECDDANYPLRGLRGLDNDSYFFKHEYNNHPHLSSYDKQEETEAKLEGGELMGDGRQGVQEKIQELEAKKESIRREIQEHGQLPTYKKNKLKYLNSQLNVLRKHVEQLEDSMDQVAGIYRVEFRWFRSSIRRGIESVTGENTADLTKIKDLDIDLKAMFWQEFADLFNSYDPVTYFYRDHDFEIFAPINKGNKVTGFEILQLLEEKRATYGDQSMAIQEIQEAIGPVKKIHKEEKEYWKNVSPGYSPGEDEEIIEVNFDPPEVDDPEKLPSYDSGDLWVKVRETEKTEVMGFVSESTISSKIKVLKEKGLVTRCNGKVSISQAGKDFLGTETVSRILAVGLSVLGGSRKILGNTERNGVQNPANSKLVAWVPESEEMITGGFDPPPGLLEVVFNEG